MRAYLSSASWIKKDKMNQEKSEHRIKFKGQKMVATVALSGPRDQDKKAARGRGGASTHVKVN